MKVSLMARLVCALSLMCCHLFGQSTTGILQGTVVDPAGAAVPDATIVITDPSAGTTRKAVSGADGIFILNGVEPGTYNLTITAKSGFKIYSVTGIPL